MFIKIQFCFICKNLFINYFVSFLLFYFYLCMSFSDHSLKRRFFISHWVGGSSGDPGQFWMGISERRDVVGTSLPAILFSPNYYSIRWTHSK